MSQTDPCPPGLSMRSSGRAKISEVSLPFPTSDDLSYADPSPIGLRNRAVRSLQRAAHSGVPPISIILFSRGKERGDHPTIRRERERETGGIIWGKRLTMSQFMQMQGPRRLPLENHHPPFTQPRAGMTRVTQAGDEGELDDQAFQRYIIVHKWVGRWKRGKERGKQPTNSCSLCLTQFRPHHMLRAWSLLWRSAAPVR